MFKGTIENIDGSNNLGPWVGTFETEAEAQAWVDVETLQAGKRVSGENPEAVFSIDDITAEYEAELAEEAENIAIREEIKRAVNIIDGWEQLNDININFLKKFFKYLIRKSI